MSHTGTIGYIIEALRKSGQVSVFDMRMIDKTFERESTRVKCEGCENEATTADSEGVPLCGDCKQCLLDEAAQG